MPAVLVVCPTGRDREELPALPGAGGHDFLFWGDDPSSAPGNHDTVAFIDDTVSRFRATPLAGVIGTHDYPASIAAAAIGAALGLPTPAPEHLLVCQHKYAARLAQQALIPEATPDFALVRLDEEPPASLRFPCFIKPVKSVFSACARRVDDAAELAAHLREAGPPVRALAGAFTALWARYVSPPARALPCAAFIAESLLDGVQVTVDGFVAGGEVTIMGVVDSIMYPGTISFERFVYPSRLPAAVQARMAALAARFVTGLGLDHTPFNIEMFHDPASGAIHIIEVNPRMSYQFADLYEKVDGSNTYALQLAIATGERPRFSPGRGPWRVARSFVLRRFRDAWVERMPDAAALAALRERFPDARIRLYGVPGRRISEQLNDMGSYRYAVINLGGHSDADCEARFAELRRGLVFDFRD